MLCGCKEADNDGFYVQAAYTFNGTTKIGGGYGESNRMADAMYGIAELRQRVVDRWRLP